MDRKRILQLNIHNNCKTWKQFMSISLLNIAIPISKPVKCLSNITLVLHFYVKVLMKHRDGFIYLRRRIPYQQQIWQINCWFFNFIFPEGCCWQMSWRPGQDLGSGYRYILTCRISGMLPPKIISYHCSVSDDIIWASHSHCRTTLHSPLQSPVDFSPHWLHITIWNLCLGFRV